MPAGRRRGCSGRLIAHDLREVGIDIDCAPVVDVAAPGMTEAIGSRSFGDRPRQVATLARAFADGLLAGGVAPVIKHLPGHGRAVVDSHLDAARGDGLAGRAARLRLRPGREPARPALRHDRARGVPRP